jgi:hypothetical protein
MELASELHLAPRLRMGEAKLSLPIGLCGVSKENFAFTLQHFVQSYVHSTDFSGYCLYVEV